jgi:hypothetical protein
MEWASEFVIPGQRAALNPESYANNVEIAGSR